MPSYNLNVLLFIPLDRIFKWSVDREVIGLLSEFRWAIVPVASWILLQQQNCFLFTVRLYLHVCLCKYHSRCGEGQLFEFLKNYLKIHCKLGNSCLALSLISLGEETTGEDVDWSGMLICFCHNWRIAWGSCCDVDSVREYCRDANL